MAPPPIPATLDGLRVPARFVRRAVVGRAARDGSLRVEAFEPWDGAVPPGLAVAALVVDGGASHYFHFAEALVWLAALLRLLPGATLGRLVFAWPWDNPAQNRVQRDVLAALYPGVPVDDPGGTWPATLEQVLVIDRAWRQTRINKFLEAAMGIAGPAVRAMGDGARAAVGAIQAPSAAEGAPRILYVPRAPPRCLLPEAEGRLVSLLGRHGPVTTSDFAAVPWAQQVRLAAAHDVLVGVHGNGLTNALWMRPGGLVLELFPDEVRHYDYQLFAELADLSYYGFERDRVYPVGSRTGEPYGHGDPTNQPVAAVPEAALARVLDAYARRRRVSAAG